MGVSHFSLLRVLADGEFHSGQQLGGRFGLSRGGIWNRIRAIESMGVKVIRVRGRGYRLARALDLLDRDILAARVKKLSPPLSIEVLDECTSTNTVLAQRAAQGAPHAAALACEQQSAGRGRRGNPWHSAIGASLAFSLLWRFPRGVGALAGLSLAVAVAAARALEDLGVTGVQVKWPNDLVRRGRKLGGILIELSGDVLGPSAVVIGIGLNVRLDSRLRARVNQPASDLASGGGPLPSRTELLVALLGSLAEVLDLFARRGFAPLRKEWLRRHVWHGRSVALSVARRRVAEGVVLGVAADGALMLRSPRGVEHFHSGELSLRPA